MTHLRPEALATLRRWRETILALLLAAAGLWLATRGGWLLGPLGGLVILAGLGWALAALRRLRFAQPGEAPGLVEVVEGRIAYFGPQVGGAVGLSELDEIQLVTLRGRRLWRLRQGDGQALLIPVEAAGADQLIDAFAGLPGLDARSLLAALGQGAGPFARVLPPGRAGGGATGRALAATDSLRSVWRRSSGAVTRG